MFTYGPDFSQRGTHFLIICLSTPTFSSMGRAIALHLEGRLEAAEVACVKFLMSHRKTTTTTTKAKESFFLNPSSGSREGGHRGGSGSFHKKRIPVKPLSLDSGPDALPRLHVDCLPQILPTPPNMAMPRSRMAIEPPTKLGLRLKWPAERKRGSLDRCGVFSLPRPASKQPSIGQFGLAWRLRYYANSYTPAATFILCRLIPKEGCWNFRRRMSGRRETPPKFPSQQ